MSETLTLEQQMRRIEAYCAHLERLAFAIPPPNPLCTELVSIAISMRNIAVEVQAGRYVNVPDGKGVMMADLDQIGNWSTGPDHPPTNPKGVETQ